MNTWNDFKETLTCFTPEEKEIMDFQAHIIGKIIVKRNELKMSQQDLAEKAGLKQSIVVRMESFSISPRLDILYKVCKVLDLKIDFVESDK